MLNTKLCTHCNIPLTGKKLNAVTCSSSCRNHIWRENQSKPISIKLVFTKPQYNTLKAQADKAGLLINALIIDRATNTNTAHSI